MIQESRDYPGMYMYVYPHIVVFFVEIKEGQVRCGEHSDYGTLTLLFQDTSGGLEVRFIDAQCPIQLHWWFNV
jgi:isopenicillin N synthase-like dioxygenase